MRITGGWELEGGTICFFVFDNLLDSHGGGLEVDRLSLDKGLGIRLDWLEWEK